MATSPALEVGIFALSAPQTDVVNQSGATDNPGGRVALMQVLCGTLCHIMKQNITQTCPLVLQQVSQPTQLLLYMLLLVIETLPIVIVQPREVLLVGLLGIQSILYGYNVGNPVLDHVPMQWTGSLLVDL